MSKYCGVKLHQDTPGSSSRFSSIIRPGRFYGIISLSIYRIVSKHASQDILNIDSLIHSVAAKCSCHVAELAMDRWHAISSLLPIISLVGQIFMLLIKHRWRLNVTPWSVQMDRWHASVLDCLGAITFSFSEVRINFVYPDSLTLISPFIPEHCSAYNGPFTCMVLVFLKKPINLSQLRIISLVCSGRMDIGKYSCCSLALVTASL